MCACTYGDGDRLGDKTAYEVRCADRYRIDRIRALGYDVEIVRECDILAKVEQDPAVSSFFNRAEQKV